MKGESMEKQFFLFGYYTPLIPSLRARQQSFTASLILHQTKGQESKWTAPQGFNLCVQKDVNYPPIVHTCQFEWNESENTAVLCAIDPEGWPGKEKLFTFLISPPEGSDYRRIGLNPEELKEGNRGKCRFVNWSSVP